MEMLHLLTFWDSYIDDNTASKTKLNSSRMFDLLALVIAAETEPKRKEKENIKRLKSKKQ